MQFSIQREVLSKPLRAVAGVVERRQMHLLPILSHVHLHIENNRLFLTTTDQEVEVVASVELSEKFEAGATTVCFRKLMDICRTLAEGSILNFVKEGERLVIKAGKSRFTLSTLPASDFPRIQEIPFNCSVTLPATFFQKLVSHTAFAMADQDVRYYLNGMLLEIKESEVVVVASDGHRLAFNCNAIAGGSGAGSGSAAGSSDGSSGGGTGAGSFRIILPRKGVLELQRVLAETKQNVLLQVGPNHMRVRLDDITLTSKLLEGRYPDYRRLIPEAGDKVIVGDREALKEAFYRAAVVIGDKTSGVRLNMTTNRLKILATNPEQDEIEEEIEVKYEGSSFEVGFNVKYLIDFLSIISTNVIKFTFTDSNSSARIESVEGEGGIYVIMPMIL